MRQKMNFFGHTKRQDSLEREIFEGIIEGRRGRGRPKRRWSQDITDRMNMNVTEDLFMGMQMVFPGYYMIYYIGLI